MSEATVQKNIDGLNKKIDKIVNKPKLPSVPNAIKNFFNKGKRF